MKIVHPWINSYKHAKRRCNNSNHKYYKWYGGRGIKFLLTHEDMEFLWKRDNADKMKEPSIDRINKNGNYELKNCQFIEMNINRIKDRLKPIIQYSLNGQFIKEWQSATQIELELKIDNSSISKCCKGIRTLAGGFIWKYKE